MTDAQLHITHSGIRFALLKQVVQGANSLCPLDDELQEDETVDISNCHVLAISLLLWLRNLKSLIPILP